MIGDWRANGERARTQLRNLIKSALDLHSDVQDAVSAYHDEGDPSRIIDYLRVMDSRVLALLIDRSDGDNLATSREEIRVAASFARNLYDYWRSRNKAEGVRDYGRHEWMKNDAVSFIFEDFFQWLSDDDWQKVRDRMERSPSLSWCRKVT